jgi:hypothetical protein
MWVAELENFREQETDDRFPAPNAPERLRHTIRGAVASPADAVQSA